MDLSIDDFLYSGDDGEAVAMPFEDINKQLSAPPDNSESNNDNSTLGNLESMHDSLLTGFEIDWLDPSLSFSQDVHTSAAPVGTDPTLDLSFLDNPQDNNILQTALQGQPLVSSGLPSLDQFFSEHGAHLSPIPCSHCARLKLQCLIIKTTSVNPNPITGCTSCASLFRDCSLAGNQKRNALAYETPLPVIGQLHGISEDGQSLAQDVSRSSMTRPTSGLGGRRINTRSVKKTRILKNWFACHLEHPYPSEEEKTMLAKQSGLSRTQVVNWFANNRRRHRMSSQAQAGGSNQLFPQGSPMPRSLLSDLSPIERWKNSPPEEEPASASAIHDALVSRSSSHSSLENYNPALADLCDSSTSGESFLYSNSVFQSGSSNSGSSCYSYRSRDNVNLFSPSAHSSGGEGPSTPWLTRSKSRAKSTKTHTFQCTFCSQSFKKKYDWIRHERSVHLPGLDSWVCSIPLPPDQSLLVWRVGESDPECIFCGHSSPSEEHIQSHEFETCAERPEAERTFTRKDHLWQHLHKFHQCRKWPGWTPRLDLLQRKNDVVNSVCGFCGKTMEGWEERTSHLAEHFKKGLTMADWTGDCGITSQ